MRFMVTHLYPETRRISSLSPSHRTGAARRGALIPPEDAGRLSVISRESVGAGAGAGAGVGVGLIAGPSRLQYRGSFS